MIREEEIVVSLNNRNKQYYIDKGYTVENNITVKINDLNINSHIEITAICDKCSVERKLAYYKYINNYNRYNHYTCKKCSRDKAKLTNNELYGADSYIQSDEGKEKYKNTCLDKYGVENVLLDPTIQAKKQKTIENKYGSKSALTDKNIKLKTIATNLKKYGAISYNKSIYFKEKIHKNWIEFYNKKLPKDYGIIDFNIKSENILSIFCNKGHYYDTSYKLLYQRTKLYSVDPCTVCNSINRQISWAEQELFNYINTLTIAEQTNKTVLDGKHIDIYCPLINIGIEFNGLYWHSELYKEKEYHSNKYRLAKLKGIKILNIYEDDWSDLIKKEQIKIILKNYITKEYKLITNYNISENKLIVNDEVIGSVVIGSFIFNDKYITNFEFNSLYDSNIIFNLLVKELKLEKHYYIHDNNNIFLNTENFDKVKNILPDYRYYNLKDKQTYNKHTINTKYKNNSIHIIEADYYKVYDSGGTIYRLSKFSEIEDFLIENNIDYFLNDDNVCFYMKDGRKFEICYIDSSLYTTKDIDKNYFYNLSIIAEENNSFIFWVKDYEWNNKVQQDILKSYILHAANKTKNKIYARDCVVKVIDSKTARLFESEHCFYGKRGASLNLGLVLKKDKGIFKKDELVMVYTFGNNFFAKKEGVVEVIRVGTKKYSQVIGGSSKLFKHFITNYKKLEMKDKCIDIKEIKFYSDYDHNLGNSMDLLGFEFVGYSKGGLMNYWIDEDKIKHRQPMKNMYVKEQVKLGKCLELPNAGVKKFIYKFI